MTVLEKIASSRLGRVEEARERVPLELLWERCGLRAPARDAAARLADWLKVRRAVIAEVKHRSPSKGPLAPDLDAAALGRAYEAGGAFAVSVLVEADWFGGGLPDLDAVRRVFSSAPTDHADRLPEDIGRGPYDTAMRAHFVAMEEKAALASTHVVKPGAPWGLVAWWTFFSLCIVIESIFALGQGVGARTIRRR